jgi:hypothetical protein
MNRNDWAIRMELQLTSTFALSSTTVARDTNTASPVQRWAGVELQVATQFTLFNDILRIFNSNVKSVLLCEMWDMASQPGNM